LSSLVRHSLGEHVPAQLLVVFLETLRASLQSLVLLCKPRELFLGLVKPEQSSCAPRPHAGIASLELESGQPEWAEVTRVRAS
jgi:hypothetical protein